MNRIDELFKKYNCDLNDEVVKQAVDEIIAAEYDANNTPAVYKTCLSLIDLTSLNSTDTTAEIVGLTNKVNNFNASYPQLPNVAAICISPAMVSSVSNRLSLPEIQIASVAAGFPMSQTFIEVKVAEVALCVLEGATEIDVVISIGKFLEENYDEVLEELIELKAACRTAHLKVIIESGALKTASNIKKASLLGMASGADFIKTSTGKIPVAATLEATYIMCTAIKEWYDKTGDKIGYKPAGGIVTTEDAVKHFTIVKHILGDEWLNNKLFRFGASRLANNLLTSIEGKEMKYF